MTERMRTLIFYATDTPCWKCVVADTLTGGFRLPAWLAPAQWRQKRYLRFLFDEGYSRLSYALDWREAFCDASGLDVKLCNINNLFEYWAGLRKLKEYPLVVILHSAAGDRLGLLRRAASYFQARRGKLLVLFGNEYKLMRDKIGFAQDVAADYIASQLPRAAAEWLYADCVKSRVLLAPPALNPELYRPESGPRSIDIGFRGDEYGYAIGDIERTELIRRMKKRGETAGLTTDIAFLRYSRPQWNEFLNACKGIVGAESGTYYLEKDDRTQQAVLEYLKKYPRAEFHEIYTQFFQNHPRPVSGKAISSRHFEPIGTKTCQILLEGDYNGILKPDEHYLSVKKDFSNINGVVERFQDDRYREQIAQRTYEYVLSEHTYRHRVQSLIKSVSQ